jgi:hypothetical protein
MNERDTPRHRVESECQARGRSAVVSGCIALLEGHEVDDQLIVALGGPHGSQVIDGSEGGKTGYWPRVWGARALLYVWGNRAVPAVIAATATLPGEYERWHSK